MSAPHAAPDSDPPEHRCGFELLPGDVGADDRYDIDDESDLSDWRENLTTASCCREAYENGRCRWHTEVDEETMRAAVEELDERDERATNLDGAVLRNVELAEETSFANCRLVGATFSNVTAQGAEFSGSILFRAEFPDADLRYAEFPDANLFRAEFPDADLFEAEFPDADLRYAEFPDTDLRYAEFPDTDLRYAEFPDADLRYAEFPDTDLRYAEFPDANLFRAEFPDADLFEAEFPDADLFEAEFSNTDLRGAEFPDADLQDTEFSNTDLRGAEFRRSTLYDADFSDTTLAGSTFIRTGAHDTDFENATLRDAEIHGCSLYQADLTNADARDAEFTIGNTSKPVNLEDAVLRETDLRNADLTDARLYQADLTDARTNRKTKLDGVTVYEERPEMLGWFRDTTDAYGAAAWVHRRLERLNEANAVSEEARQFHIRKQEAEREGHRRRALRKFRAWRNGANPDGTPTTTDTDDTETETDGGHAESQDANEHTTEQVDPDEDRTFLYHAYRFLALSLMYHLSYHGESLQLIGKRAAQIILVAGVLYPLTGGVASDATGDVHEYPTSQYATADSASDVGVFLLDSAVELLWGIYFSIITFTTIGYGDLYPVGTGSKVLVGAESLAGAILVALFVFVLGRRVAR